MTDARGAAVCSGAADAYCQVPADIADNKVTDKTTLCSEGGARRGGRVSAVNARITLEAQAARWALFI